MPTYEYHCPKGRKDKTHHHEIHSDRKQGAVKCQYCKTPMTLEIFGLWNRNVPLKPEVVKKTESKATAENFENPSDNLKKDVEGMAA